MGNLLSYSLQAAVIMTLLYLGYKWLMASTTFHATNRLTLLLIIAISWVAPALTPLFAPRPAVDIEIGIPIVIVDGEPAVAPAETPVDWAAIVVMIYIIGMIAATAVTLAGALKVWRIVRRGERSRLGRYTLVVSGDAPGPFSWGRYIVIRPEDCDEYREMVTAHERAHLDRLHWADLLAAHLNIILQWYSPAAYLMLHEMKCVHEYQADRSVAGPDPYDYQIMLLKKTVGSSFPTFADSLNHSQIKHRLTMMMQNETKAWRRLTALAIPAMTVAALTVLAIPSVASVIDSLRDAPVAQDFTDKVTKSPLNGQIHSVTRAMEIAVDESAADESEAVEADRQKKENEMREVEMEEISVIKLGESSGEKSAASDSHPAYFVDGKLFTGSINELDPSTIKAMSIVKNDPAYPQGKIMIELLKPGEEKVRAAAMQMADFKGGQKEMMNFLTQNMRYPENVKIDKPVRVIVQFTVGTDGSVSDARILKGAPAGADALNEEAMRVVALMNGHWNPATDNGTPVATKFTLPVSFSPNQPKDEK